MALALITCTRGSPANCRAQVARKGGSSSNNNNCASGRIRRAISRECTPSPGPYSAITRARSKSILLGDPLDQRFRAGDDRGDLKRPFKETLEKKNAHRESE